MAQDAPKPSRGLREDEELARATQDLLAMTSTSGGTRAGTATGAAEGESHSWILCPDVSDEALSLAPPVAAAQTTTIVWQEID